MTRLLKWLVTAAATLLTFVVCLWVGWWVGTRLWQHELQSTADRWVVAAAFATVMAGAVLAWAGWWAGRGKEPGSDQQAETQAVWIQDVHADQGSSAYGVQHGNQRISHYRDSDTESKANPVRKSEPRGQE